MPNCKSCGAPIVWGRTSSGKRIPLDTKTEMRFYFWDDDAETGHTVSNRVRQVCTYVSHFATCPDAAKHRKPKKQGDLL